LKIIFFIIFFYLFNFSFSVAAPSIAIVNIQSLIDKNIYYIKIINDIEINQDKYLDSFAIEEIELKKLLNEIEESKILLNENEINLQINYYNNRLNEFQKLVDDFNFHYQNQIINIRDYLFREILKLLEKYAIENSIDLILDSASYLIASNSLDITEDIKSDLEELKFNLEYKDFEKN